MSSNKDNATATSALIALLASLKPVTAKDFDSFDGNLQSIRKFIKSQKAGKDAACNDQRGLEEIIKEFVTRLDGALAFVDPDGGSDEALPLMYRSLMNHLGWICRDCLGATDEEIAMIQRLFSHDWAV